MVYKIEDKYSIIGIFGSIDVKYGQHKCWKCNHVFEVGEKVAYLPTSEKKYGDYHSSFCLPCVNKMLMGDEDRINEELDKAEQREISRKRAEITTRQR